MKQANDCLFCKIIRNEIPSQKVYETEKILVFKDISAQAPIHWLCIHKNHTADIMQMASQNPEELAEIFKTINLLAEQEGFAKKGFRIINNCGSEGGQTVFHTHFHIMAGKRLKWDEL